MGDRYQGTPGGGRVCEKSSEDDQPSQTINSVIGNLEQGGYLEKNTKEERSDRLGPAKGESMSGDYLQCNSYTHFLVDSNHFHPTTTNFKTRDMKNKEKLDIYWECYRWGKVNACGARIPLSSNWNIRLLTSLCESRSDREVLTYLTYGWPLNRRQGPVAKTYMNHRSAQENPIHLSNYIRKEMEHDTLLGPFLTSPFPAEVTGISPMSTRPKKEEGKRRVIVDLSWPPDGDSVNKLIPRDTFMEARADLKYPTIDRLCRRAAKVGPKAVGWKKDMERAFRQVPLDPLAWSYLGVQWEGLLYFDLAEVMGCRSAPYVMQRVTNTIRHIMKNLRHIIFNYVDDFMGIDEITPAWRSFKTLGNLLRDLGVNEAAEKTVQPSHIIEFLGIVFDMLRQIILLPEGKLKEIKQELNRWSSNNVDKKSLKQLQSLAGRLQFAAICVRPGRVFIIRLYDKIAEVEKSGSNRVQIDGELMKDIEWWQRYMADYNGVSMMWMDQIPECNGVMATDASLTGLGGFCRGQYFHLRIPKMFRRKGEIIADFEILAILVALRLWAASFRGTRFVLDCDNQTVVGVLNGKKSKNPFLQACLREVTECLAKNQCEIVVRYINTKKNTIPDWLSRWDNPSCRQNFQNIREADWTEMIVGRKHYTFTSGW